MGKLRSLKNNSLTNSKKKERVEDKSEDENVNLDEGFESVENKKTKLIKKVQFKKTKKESKSAIAKIKKSDDPSKEKYDSIKSNLLKQIKQSEKPQEQGVDNKEELNFINRSNRLTNSLIKSIIKKNVEGSKLDVKSASILSMNNSKAISKKSKDKLKKQVWHERISLIKNQLKEKADKVKREKTVITGDMKPMIDSLDKKEQQTDLSSLVVNKSNEIGNLSRKEKREKNIQNQKAKVTQKQSIRNKTTKDDISLFNQLLDYSEFANNPLETLKKHLSK